MKLITIDFHLGECHMGSKSHSGHKVARQHDVTIEDNFFNFAYLCKGKRCLA